MPLSGFFNNERLENIYDGPSYRDSNAYLDVTVSSCPADGYNGKGGCIYGSNKTSGLLNKNPGGATPDCYLPNAAIAWKQPNGFFYPPAFHANNLYFGNVDIRHFVIDPLFKAFSGSISPSDFGQGGTYITDQDAVKSVYCLPPSVNLVQYFNDLTSIDRQTELNDDDGTLTGLSNNIQQSLDPPNPLKQTISVNEDDYFTAPVETPECASNIGKNVIPLNACTSPSKAAPTVTAKASPYDYVSTFVSTTGSDWNSDCTNPSCYGVPLYRQFLAGNPCNTKTDPKCTTTPTREWKHWYQNGCDTNRFTTKCRWPFIRMAGTDTGIRETLTVNNGTYYLDTTVSADLQNMEDFNTRNGGNTQTLSINAFNPGQTYYVFFAYAKPSTRQTYEIYLGADATTAAVKPIQVPIFTKTLQPMTLQSQPWLTTSVSGTLMNRIVTVTVDFTQLKDGSLDTVPANGLCEPHSFCQANGTACQSALTDTDPLVTAYQGISTAAATAIKNQATAVCSQWAVKDLDCPPKGCYGFSFTIPGTGFSANATKDNPSPNRPAPEPFPDNATNQGKPTWLVKFLATTVEPDATAGQCHYNQTTLPGTTCTVPDWIPQ